MSRRFLLSGLSICHRETRIEVQSTPLGPAQLLRTFCWFYCLPDNKQSTATNTLHIHFMTYTPEMNPAQALQHKVGFIFNAKHKEGAVPWGIANRATTTIHYAGPVEESFVERTMLWLKKRQQHLSVCNRKQRALWFRSW